MNQFEYEDPKDHDNKLTITPHLDGSIFIEIEDEQAVDSYNATFNSSITIPLETVYLLKEWLSKL